MNLNRIKMKNGQESLRKRAFPLETFRAEFHWAHCLFPDFRRHAHSCDETGRLHSRVDLGPLWNHETLWWLPPTEHEALLPVGEQSRGWLRREFGTLDC